MKSKLSFMFNLNISTSQMKDEKDEKDEKEKNRSELENIT
jgi:hypothetical protein